jgi:hypothetical protein
VAASKGLTTGKTKKKNLAPKVPNPNPSGNYMKVAGKDMKKAKAWPMKQKRLSK